MASRKPFRNFYRKQTYFVRGHHQTDLDLRCSNVGWFQDVQYRCYTIMVQQHRPSDHYRSIYRFEKNDAIHRDAMHLTVSCGWNQRFCLQTWDKNGMINQSDSNLITWNFGRRQRTRAIKAIRRRCFIRY